MINKKTDAAFRELFLLMEAFAREQGAENISRYAAELERLEEENGYSWSVRDWEIGLPATWPQHLTDLEINAVKQLAQLAEILQFKDASE